MDLSLNIGAGYRNCSNRGEGVLGVFAATGCQSVPMKRRLGRVANHNVTKSFEKLDARPLEGHFAMRLPGRLARDIRSRWKTSHSKVIFCDFIAIGEHLLSSRGREKRSACLFWPRERCTTLPSYDCIRYAWPKDPAVVNWSRCFMAEPT